MVSSIIKIRNHEEKNDKDNCFRDLKWENILIFHLPHSENTHYVIQSKNLFIQQFYSVHVTCWGDKSYSSTL